ncbi:hypothetical protein JXO59_13630 [candidate division KSB1 bacterium]|nr:hypothetical protein [candidate division KSB1 bacterium]
MLYTGIDLHKDNCFMTTIDEAGNIVNREHLGNDETEFFFIPDWCPAQIIQTRKQEINQAIKTAINISN